MPKGSGLLAVDNIKLTNAKLSPLNGISLAELDEIISTQAVEIDASTLSTAHVESKYTDYKPGKPATTADPGLDEEGEIPDYVPSEEERNNANKKYNIVVELIKKVFNKIISFFKKTFHVLSLDWLFNII